MRYDATQLAVIREVIAGLPLLSPDDAARRNAAVAAGRCPSSLWPLWPLADANPALWDALAGDGRIADFSVYGLFPAAYELVYGGAGAAAQIRYDGRTRGRVAIISGYDADGRPRRIVIKPQQSRAEPAIAAIAGAMGVGPQQLPTIPGFISEEFVDGAFLTELPPDTAAPARMRVIGSALGEAIRRLHHAGICYNDAAVADPEGRSHLIVRPDGSLCLIDFGISLLLREHPAALTFEDAWNAARTDPMFRLFRQMSGGGDNDALMQFVAEYGRRLAGQTPAEIQARDWRIAGEGATELAKRYGPDAAAALRAGLTAATAAQ